jgi:UDP-N-acetylglucosamine--N-acetylmuramyl-(pentapeptide) pyrophosphoryl-undecaprenol N-acetylglucosamine transferase
MLIVGGSLGAATLNRMVGDARAELTRDWMVVHQTGTQRGGQAVDEPGYRSRPYFDDELPDLLAAADAVVSRAGATALAEFAATGTAAVLVPLPRTSSRGEQIVNARLLAAAGAALVLQPGAQTASGLLRCARRLTDDRLRARMSAAIRSLDRPDAADEVVRHTLRAARLQSTGHGVMGG